MAHLLNCLRAGGNEQMRINERLEGTVGAHPALRVVRAPDYPSS